MLEWIYIGGFLKRSVLSMKIFNTNKLNIGKLGKRKKYLCMFLIFLYVLSEPVLLCGCASPDDGIIIDVPDAGAPESNGRDDNNEAVNELVNETVPAEKQEPRTQFVYIYVCGAVELPGVYSLREGSRIYEAVEMAGGLTGDADGTCLNMARQISDGEQVVILTQTEAAELKAAGINPAGGTDGGNSAKTDSCLVNINTAGMAELTTVPGIGEGRAQAIINYREKTGSFGSIEDIKNVEGIKDGLFSKIKDKITV